MHFPPYTHRVNVDKWRHELMILFSSFHVGFYHQCFYNKFFIYSAVLFTRFSFILPPYTYKVVHCTKSDEMNELIYSRDQSTTNNFSFDSNSFLILSIRWKFRAIWPFSWCHLARWDGDEEENSNLVYNFWIIAQPAVISEIMNFDCCVWCSTIVIMHEMLCTTNIHNRTNKARRARIFFDRNLFDVCSQRGHNVERWTLANQINLL